MERHLKPHDIEIYLEYLKDTKMDANEFAGSGDWLSAEELKGRTVTLKITSVEVVIFDNDRGQDKKLGLMFDGKEKGICANKTNVKALIEGFGSDTDSWIGRELIAAPNQTPLGLGFSLRPVMPAVGTEMDDDIPF